MIYVTGLTKFLQDKQTEMLLTPVSHIVSRMSFKLSDITVVKPRVDKRIS